MNLCGCLHQKLMHNHAYIIYDHMIIHVQILIHELATLGCVSSVNCLARQKHGHFHTFWPLYVGAQNLIRG